MFFHYFSFNSFNTHMHTHVCVDEDEEEGGEERRTLCNSSMYDGTVGL